jgi:type II restriction enzyme
MATAKQELGKRGEELVCRHSKCPRCKRARSLKRLPPNFKCADVICDFCGYLAQVKTSRCTDISSVPDTVLGAAWAPQKERMDSGIYFPLFLVLIAPDDDYSCYYLSADLQSPEIFSPRKPLSSTARRAGWQGFMYILRHKKSAFVRVFPTNSD